MAPNLEPLATDTGSNTRPNKRKRADSVVSYHNTLTVEGSLRLTPLPPHILLLNLPALLIHPPSHPNYALSLCLSLLALRQCLAMKDSEKGMQGMVMDAEIECRAWTALAEIGMSVVEAGFSSMEDHAWARAIEAEVCGAASLQTCLAFLEFTLISVHLHCTFQIEKATGKGLQIAQTVRICLLYSAYARTYAAFLPLAPHPPTLCATPNALIRPFGVSSA